MSDDRMLRDWLEAKLEGLKHCTTSDKGFAMYFDGQKQILTELLERLKKEDR